MSELFLCLFLLLSLRKLVFHSAVQSASFVLTRFKNRRDAFSLIKCAGREEYTQKTISGISGMDRL